MIAADARLTIQRIPLHCIQIKEYQERYPDKLNLYMKLLKQFPNQYAGLLYVTPSDTHLGMYALLDGHHKFCASVMMGRPDALCVVIEEPKSLLQQGLDLATKRLMQDLARSLETLDVPAQGEKFEIPALDPSKKHDGMLNEQRTSHVRYGYSNKNIHIVERTGNAALTSHEALSLLAWLRQEEPALQGLAE